MKKISFSNYIKSLLTSLTVCTMICAGFNAYAAEKDFTVVIDPGHGGKDHGAIDNNAREKDINLAVAKRLGELLKRKLDDTKVVFTRDDDTFISLQGRAEIANKAKGDLFISIHTNSLDTKNKNRANVAGASVYTVGNHKDDANMSVARRENSVIELENGYEQKYSGFDPNKDESYIIFEMAQKKNVSQSNRFAKMVQDNLVKKAGRKDRGVHQAGFWVLWSTSMPSVLIELDFICNPESAKFMTSKSGVDKLADAIFQAVKIYEQNYRQSRRMASQYGNRKGENAGSDMAAGKGKRSGEKNGGESVESRSAGNLLETTASTAQPQAGKESEGTSTLGIAYVPEDVAKDMSHANLIAAKNQKKPRTTADGRRRRSASSKKISAKRNVEGEIRMFTEFKGATEIVTAEPMAESKSMARTEDSNSKKKDKKGKKNKKEKIGKKNKGDSSKKEYAKGDDKDKGKRASSSKSDGKNKELTATMKARMAREKMEKERKEREKKEKNVGSDVGHAAKRKSLRSRSEK